jgi:glycosyltransferase involved in cell wall biosynthesis
VTPGVDCPAPGTEASDPAEARHGLGISPRALVVGQVGMSLWQGWRELLHSVPKLRDQFPNVLVLFAGSASRTQRRTALRVINEMGLRDHVRVMPPGLAAATVLRACDVVVDSSWAGRGFLWSPARAMALARPVVATATSGADELIQDGVSGILVPVREPLTLAAAVARLLRDPNLAAGMGLAGQLRVRELFSLSDYAQRLESLYDGALLDTA